jgi:heterodisulfide reductase subunit C
MYPHATRCRIGDVDTMLTVPRSFLCFYCDSCSQLCERAIVPREANTRFSTVYPRLARARRIYVKLRQLPGFPYSKQ